MSEHLESCFSQAGAGVAQPCPLQPLREGSPPLLLPLLLLGNRGMSPGPSFPKHIPHEEGQCGWEGRVSVPIPGWRCSLILPQALLQPKQRRSSNPLRVGSSGRSRVSLSRLPSLIIPRELPRAAAMLLPCGLHPLPATRVPWCTALPVLCRASCPKPPCAITLHSSPAAAWRRRCCGVARAWEGVQPPSKGGQNVAPLQGVNI